MKVYCLAKMLHDLKHKWTQFVRVMLSLSCNKNKKILMRIILTVDGVQPDAHQSILFENNPIPYVLDNIHMT